MGDKHTVLSFDLSKSSTGVSIVEVEDFNLKIKDVFSLKRFKAENFNKLYHYSVKLLMSEIEEIFCSQKGYFTVAFEFNSFGDYTSELGFYLCQELLHLCYKYNINAVGYSIYFIKKFIKSFVLDKNVKYPGRLQKNHIRDIYEKYIYPLNFSVLPDTEAIRNSDEMDALMIGILGSIFHSNFLTHDIIELGEREPYLIKDENYYRDKFLNSIDNFKFNNFKFNDQNISFGKQFKKLLKDADKNRHLSLKSKLFFPYYIFYRYTLNMMELRDIDEGKFNEYWIKKLQTNKAWLKKNFRKREKDIICLFDNIGKVFLYPKSYGGF